MTLRRMGSSRFAAVLLAVWILQGCAGSADRVEGARSAEQAGEDDLAGPAGSEAVRAISPAETSVAYSDLDGIHDRIAGHRGRPLLLNFWATWCVPCVDELPDLARLAEEYGEEGPAFLGISFDAWVTGADGETEEKVRGALAKAGITYANLIYDGDQDPILSAFDLPGPIPYSILLDREGEAAASWDSAIDIDGLRSAIAGLP